MLKETIKFDTLFFDSIEQMDEYIEDKDYKDKQKICFGIYIFESNENRWDYALRFNITNHFYTSDLPSTNGKRINYLSQYFLFYYKYLKKFLKFIIK